MTSNSGTRLLPYSFNPGAAGHPLSARYGAAQWPFALVLPGERYVGESFVAVHPTFPPFTPYASMKSVMYTHPIMVEMRARYDAILPIPWLVPSTIAVRVLGFRELPADRNMQPGPIQLTTVTSVSSTTSTSVVATTSSAPTTVVTTTTSFGSSTTTTTSSAGTTSVATTTTTSTLDCPPCPRGAYRVSADSCTCACRPGWRPNGRGGCSRGSE